MLSIASVDAVNVGVIEIDQRIRRGCLSIRFVDLAADQYSITFVVDCRELGSP
jgi:hypothetical protein